MAMSAGGNERGGLTNEPNVVPMIDIMLVLLIIFMLMQPMLRKAIDLQLPDPSPPPSTSTPNLNQIVLEVGPNGDFHINKEAVPRDRLAARLKEIYEPRPEKVIFLKADGKNVYQDVIDAMDIARGSGVRVIGIAPKT